MTVFKQKAEGANVSCLQSLCLEQ